MHLFKSLMVVMVLSKDIFIISSVHIALIKVNFTIPQPMSEQAFAFVLYLQLKDGIETRKFKKCNPPSAAILFPLLKCSILFYVMD